MPESARSCIHSADVIDLRASNTTKTNYLIFRLHTKVEEVLTNVSTIIYK